MKQRWFFGLAAAVSFFFALETVASAAEIHVSTIGNDGAAGSLAAPYRTLRRALNRAGPGDMVLLHAGTYPEAISTDEGDIRGGTSWSNALVIAALPGETVVLQPPAGKNRVVQLSDAGASYIIIRGLALDARNVQSDAVKITWSSPGPSNVSHHIRIEDSEVSGAPRQGVLVTSPAHHNEFIRLRVHHNGSSDFYHGFYLAGPDNLADGCEVFDNSGWGFNVYNGTTPDADRNVIRNNRIHHNARVGRRGAGIILASGEDNLAYNNVVFANKVGIHVDYGAVRARIYNNTVFQQTEHGIHVGGEATDTDVRNNLVFANHPDFSNMGTRSTTGTNFIGFDAGIVNPATFDAHLRETSSAIDAGATIEAVGSDYDRVPRPQGSGYDVGAFEFPRTRPPTLLPVSE